MLNHLIDYVQNLEKVGLLEKKEMLHLHDAVQVTLESCFFPSTENMYIVCGVSV